MSSDFTPVGDGGGIIVVSGNAFGQGLFNAGPFGGGSAISFAPASTTWTDIDTGIITDFTDSGDLGQQIIVSGGGYGEGGYGEGGYGGGSVTTIISGSPTVWTNIDTP